MSARRLPPADQRVVAAFAEVMSPRLGPLPAAEPDLGVADSVAELWGRLPERQARFMRLGIRAFDRAMLPRRFAEASRERRLRFIERMARSRSVAHRELLMLMKTLVSISYASDERVRAIVGYEAACAVAGPPPEDGGPLGDLDAPAGGEDCDVVIVGSGAGGAVAAAELAEAGLEVVVLEAGPSMSAGTYPESPIDANLALYRDAGLTVAEGLPPVPVPVGRAVGGTTVVNSGTCFPTPPEVLEQWRTEHGLGWAPALEEEFGEVERMLDVAPVDPARMGINGALVALGADRIGAGGHPLRRNAGSCVQCSSCPQGCRIDAKRGAHVTYLPRAVAAGARVRSGVEVDRILIERGVARGVSAKAAESGAPARRFEVRARSGVVVCAGALGTPELLLRSGLSHPGIGRGLRLHPSSWVGARFADPVRGWEGVMQSYGVDAWAAQGLMLEATFTPLAYGGQWLPGVGAEHQERLLAFDRIASNGVQLRDRVSQGRVRLDRRGRLRISYRLRASEARRLAFGIARAAEIWFAAGAEEVYPQVSGNPILRRGDLDRFESSPPRAHSLRLESFHPMASVAAGSDPARHPLTPAGAVRGAERLLVADASMFPTSLGVNPMVTVMACAARVSRGFARSLNDDGRPRAAVV